MLETHTHNKQELSDINSSPQETEIHLHEFKTKNSTKDAIPSSFDYVDALNMVKTAIKVGISKAESTTTLCSSLCVLLKASMSGSYLSMTISLSLYAISIGWDKISAMMLFPIGFVILILMGNDLATGNFMLLPMAYWARNKKNGKEISIRMVVINWLVVYTGNFIGAVVFLFVYWAGMTHFGQRSEDKYAAFKAVLCTVTRGKTLEYADTGGAAGWFAALFNGILCNWLVCLGVMLSFSSRSTIGKVIAMYIPILVFICLGFEHSIVNLYLLPAGLTFECNTYSGGQWWAWNQIPVTLGNLVGGMGFTGLVYFLIWSSKIN
eukprot:858815_1